MKKTSPIMQSEKQMIMQGQPTEGQMASGGQAQASPTPTPNYVPPTPPTPVSSMDVKAEGGAVSSSGGGIKEFFADVNILDIVISAFIVAGVTYAIYYYKYMIKLEKTGYTDLSNRMLKLESSVKAREAEMNAIGNAMKGKKPLMRIA